MKRILYTRPDGGMSIVTPVASAQLSAESDTDFMKRVQTESVPADALDIAVVLTASIPVDREFRDAWRHTAGNITVDIPKAHVVHEAHIHSARVNHLKDLNEQEGLGKDVTVEKTQLRRMVVLVPASAQTPEAISRFWPLGLPRKSLT